MDLLIGIILIVCPLTLIIILSTRGINKKLKTIVWIICLISCGAGIIKLVTEKITKKDILLMETYNKYLLEMQELRARGHPQEYIAGLIDNPLTRHYLEEGLKYKNKFKYDKAILQYKQCLEISTISESNKVAANILIGNCYYYLSKLNEAEDHFFEAYYISKNVENEDEKLRGESSALGNIGLIYHDKGELDKALKYHKDALKIAQEIGYKQGEASVLGNIGLIYDDKGELDEALKYHKDALKIAQEIGDKQGEANDLGNIGIIYGVKGELEKALKYLNESLIIFKHIGEVRKIDICEKTIKDIKNKMETE